jgi:hypothetical protein
MKEGEKLNCWQLVQNLNFTLPRTAFWRLK